jgi:hypothetical protein
MQTPAVPTLEDPYLLSPKRLPQTYQLNIMQFMEYSTLLAIIAHAFVTEKRVIEIGEVRRWRE